jgi:uncharacterized phage infection (PIP) family protein YhgE
MIMKPGLLFNRSHIVALLLALGLTACSSSEDFSDKLRAQGSQLGEQADQWSNGQKMVKNGNDLISEGREQVEEGRQKIAKGQEMASEGHRLKDEVEAKYAASRADPKVN